MEKRKESQNQVQIAIRIDRETLREYKRWLLENGYRSINQHLNECVRKAIGSDSSSDRK